ncbi:hypothetical protein BKA65DRAFT_496195 [Rhexocercosporidium sp. MPI-PUGE-AT-0058]|nr:hypothetical protein BKA65DRAFT_496195 [Rhexocercosporidium sp. MPI-PUGE-AT-0058]
MSLVWPHLFVISLISRIPLEAGKAPNSNFAAVNILRCPYLLIPMGAKVVTPGITPFRLRKVPRSRNLLDWHSIAVYTCLT